MARKVDQIADTVLAEGWSSQLVHRLDQQREHARQFLGQQRVQFEDLEARIMAQLEALSRQLAHDDPNTAAELSQLQNQAAELDRRTVELNQLKQDLEQREERWGHIQNETSQRQEALLEELRRQQETLQQRSQHIAGEEESLRQARDQHREEAEQRYAEFTKRQAELDKETATSHEAVAETKRLAAQLEEAHEQAESQQAAAQVALSQARGDQEELREQLSLSRKQLQVQNEQLDELRKQVEQLQQRLAEVESSSTTGSERSAADSREMDDLRRRFELAVEDVRELKSRNAELEKQCAQAASSAPSTSTGAASGGALDWEAQKQKMLAQLDDDFDEDDEQDDADRLTVEGTIRITDQVVTDKEQEIAELKKQLEEQSSGQGQANSLDNVAVGASAIAEMLDQDELIKQERENLVRIQEEWREKLRKAEIDISVERAKIAREKSQLEDRLQTFESQQRAQHQQDEQAGSSSDSPKRSSGNRWLARLGLNEGDKS